jgi:hypothetical protein
VVEEQGETVRCHVMTLSSLLGFAGNFIYKVLVRAH